MRIAVHETFVKAQFAVYESVLNMRKHVSRRFDVALEKRANEDHPALTIGLGFYRISRVRNIISNLTPQNAIFWRQHKDDADETSDPGD